MNGHFFCDNCNDIVNVHFQGREVVSCPVCRKHSARWVKHLPSSNAGRLVDSPLAAQLFTTLKGAVKQ